jgi:hypothetical protein
MILVKRGRKPKIAFGFIFSLSATRYEMILVKRGRKLWELIENVQPNPARYEMILVKRG